MLKKSYNLLEMEPIIEEEDDFDDDGQTLNSKRSMLRRSIISQRLKIKVSPFDKRNYEIFNKMNKADSFNPPSNDPFKKIDSNILPNNLIIKKHDEISKLPYKYFDEKRSYFCIFKE